MADGPLIIRTGVTAFDRQIEGERGIGLDTSTPTPMGLGQKLIGVSWPSGFLIYAATSLHKDGNFTKATLASSKDGVNWSKPTTFFQAGALCGIAGQTNSGLVMVAGGYYQSQFPLDSGGQTTLMFPQFYISTDKGKSWTTSRPSWNTSATFSKSSSIFTAGYVSGIGYEPRSKLFYAVVQKQTSTADSFDGDQLLFSGGVSGLVEVSSQHLFTIGAVSTPFPTPPQAPWPSGAFVNDCPIAIDETSNPQLMYSSAPNKSIHFAAVNVDPQHMSGGPLGNATVDMGKDNFLSSTVGSTHVQASSGTLSKKYLAYVGDAGNVQTVAIDSTTAKGTSKDFGAGFAFTDYTFVVPYLVADGELLAVNSSSAEYATVSFSGASHSKST